MRKSYWFSKLFNGSSWDDWANKHGKTLLEKAHDLVESVTTDCKTPEPVIGESKFEKLNYIVKCADGEFSRER
jgi:Txe/YoeB family toxin of Txe-Axe toxin-antitoxin module